jgi:hypothetical protein
LFNTIAPDRRNDPELGKMGADRIDHCGLLTDEQMAGAVEHQAALLLERLIIIKRCASPPTVARVEGLVSRRHLPGSTNALEAAKAKGLHQVNRAIA